MTVEGAPPTTPDGAIPTVAWRSDRNSGIPGALHMVDQTRLPHEPVELSLTRVEDVRDAILRLSVRGAPAIGVAAAYGLVVGVQGHVDADQESFRARLGEVAEMLRESRPTAVNLGWAVDRCIAAVGATSSPAEATAALLAEARAIHEEDERACEQMGRHALELLEDGGSYLTHCNTGRFATAGIGTAFGVFVTGAHAGLSLEVYAPEVRPLLQGSRLTTFELIERGIPGTLLPDSASPTRQIA